MKKLLLTFAIALLTALCAVAQQYDFIAQSGTNTLYYKITNAANKQVAVVSEFDYDVEYRTYTTKPIGELIIPSIVIYEETEYSVTSIETNALRECRGLIEITIPSSVTSIGYSAFWFCESLTKFIVNASNPNYSSKDGILYNKDQDILIVCPEGKTGRVIIPNSVTSIGEGAFYECSGLTGDLIIPNSIISIGDYAFRGCSGFTGTLTIPNSVTTIGYCAFYDCSGFTGFLTIPNSVISIGDYAFRGCSGFTGTLTIPDSVTTIGNYVFYGCSGLGSLTIPNSVIIIGEGSFAECTGLTGTLTIPDSVITIGNYAFQNCTGLIGTLTIPNSVTTIGNYAFSFCSGFTGTLTIPNSVISMGEAAFVECTGFTGTLTIPNSVTIIEDYAFRGCSGLTGDLIIGNSVTSIGYAAFYECSGLTGDLTIPNSVTTIEDYAFIGCNGLTGFVLSASNPKYSSKYGILYNKAQDTLIACPTGKTEVTIHSDVKTIGKYAFKNCSSLTGSFTIPGSVTSIEEGAFAYCSGLTEFIVSADNASFSSIDGILYNKAQDTLIACPGSKIGELTIPGSVTTIREAAFSGCEGLIGTLTIPSSVITIESEAFSDCIGLTEVTILDANTYIGGDVFVGTTWYDSLPNDEFVIVNGILIKYNGSGKGELTIPSTVTNIAGQVFEEKGFTGALIIPNVVTSIGYGAFVNCHGLTSLTIGNSETTIGEVAFAYCTGLTEVINKATVPQDIDSDVFYGLEINEITLYVPKASIEAYIVAEVWKDFKNIIALIDDITIDLDSAFNQIDLLEYFIPQHSAKMQFVASSNKPEVASITINGCKFGIIPRSVGVANISIVAKSQYGTVGEINFTVSVTNEDGGIIKCTDFVVNETITNVQCPGTEIGSIELEVSGNTAPYKYRWSNTQTSSGIYNLAAGEYTVIISDSLGCVETKTYEVQGVDSIKFAPTIVKPGCDLSDGSISVAVTGGTAPYSYRWNNIPSIPEMTEIPSGIYNLVVKDANGCEHSEAIALNSEDAPEIIVDLIKNPKCGVKQGEIHVSVNGGTPPYNHTWSDGGTGLNRTELIDTVYTLEVIDQNNCKANLIAEIKSLSFLKPDIGLVTVDRTTGNNLIIWQKEKTEGIEKYNIYREDTVTKNYDFIGSWDYNEISVYEDTEVDPNESSWRYKLQAENNCGERSQLSESFKTMHIKGAAPVNQDGVLLYWDDYEGKEYPTYSLYRLFNDRSELITTVPSHTTYYFDKTPLTEDVRAYFVAVELPEAFDVKNDYLKAESGPFVLAVSNIAEVEINAGGGNDDETSLNSVLNQILVYPTVANEKVNVAVGAGQQAQVSLYTLTGEKVYEQEVLETAELNVSSMPNGVYTVVVTIDGVGYGYKIIVND